MSYSRKYSSTVDTAGGGERHRKLHKDVEKLNNYIEVHDRTRKKALVEEDDTYDLAADFQRQRIKSDQERERERKKFRDEKLREKQERQRVGVQAWYDQREEVLQDKLKQKEKDKKEELLLADIGLRKEIREEKRKERDEMNKRLDDYEKLRRRWREEDERKERERALDEKREREVAWSRLDLKKSELAREREEWKKEYEKREQQRAIEKEIRENREKAEKERDHSAAFDLERISERRKKEKFRQNNLGDLLVLGQGVENDLHNLSIHRHMRETYRHKGHLEARSKRLKEAEEQMDSLKKWYSDRDHDRIDRHYNRTTAI